MKNHHKPVMTDEGCKTSPNLSSSPSLHTSLNSVRDIEDAQTDTVRDILAAQEALTDSEDFLTCTLCNKMLESTAPTRKPLGKSSWPVARPVVLQQ